MPEEKKIIWNKMNISSYSFLYILMFFILTADAQNKEDSTIVYDKPKLLDFIVNVPTDLAAEDSTILYDKPKLLDFIVNVPTDLAAIAKSPFEKKNLLGLTAISVSTGILIWQDQQIYDGVKQLSKNIHLSGEAVNKVPVKIDDARIIKIPQNLNTALYQLGEGGTSMLVTAGIFIQGLVKHNNHSLAVASDLTETFITMGIAEQILKRSFGRQTPFKSTMKGGEWNFFPSFSNYEKNTPAYDAFPSGHLATMMATVSVLSMHYPEKKWIKYLGYTLMTLTSYAMINTDVHWAGDYPLALGIGYISAQTTVSRHHKKIIYKE
jgi:hypothetical protein